MQEDFTKKSVIELRSMAKKMGLKGTSTLRKEDLIRAVALAYADAQDAPEGKRPSGEADASTQNPAVDSSTEETEASVIRDIPSAGASGTGAGLAKPLTGSARFNGKPIKKTVHFSKQVNPTYYKELGRNKYKDAEQASGESEASSGASGSPDSAASSAPKTTNAVGAAQNTAPKTANAAGAAQDTAANPPSDTYAGDTRQGGQRDYSSYRQDNRGYRQTGRDYGDYQRQGNQRYNRDNQGYARYNRDNRDNQGYNRYNRDQQYGRGDYNRDQQGYGRNDYSRDQSYSRSDYNQGYSSRYSRDNQGDYGRDLQRDYTQRQDYRDYHDGQGDYYEQDLPREYSFGHYPDAIEDIRALDSGETTKGILEILPDGYGFIRSNGYLPGDKDVYVSPSQIKRFDLKTGDEIVGSVRKKTNQEKFSALLLIQSINNVDPEEFHEFKRFETLTPIFPNQRLNLEGEDGKLAMRVIDLMAPIGKGQRGMIVSPPKAGKTSLLKQIAKGVIANHPDMHLIILLIDERPEEVTDIQDTVVGDNVEVVYSTFDDVPEHHKKMAEMVLDRSKRLVEMGEDVIILLDSLTRLTRAYNLTVTPSGRTLSGGLDPAALTMPKKFFGAARNMKEGGSLTIVATALVDTGSRMDDIVFEEFRGTGNMEVVLDRKLSERRIFPAIELTKSGTRRDDLLLTQEEFESVFILRKALNGLKSEEAAEKIIDMFARTKNNAEVVEMARKIRLVDM